jgi:hypothetical protein
MAIDIVSIRLYTCCNCQRQWTNWDNVNRREGKTPLNCPSCKTVRWNLNYIKEERVLIDRLNDEHLIKKDAWTERVRYRYRPYKVHETTYSYFDFIAYDFLCRMIPSPDLFELKQVMEIPVNNNNNSEMERRHDLMLSMIKDRIDNNEEYAKERFSKYAARRKVYCDVVDHDKKSRQYSNPFKYYPSIRMKMDGCNHEDKEEVRTILPKIYHYDYHYGMSRWIIPEAATYVKDYEASSPQQKEKE